MTADVAAEMTSAAEGWSAAASPEAVVRLVASKARERRRRAAGAMSVRRGNPLLTLKLRALKRTIACTVGGNNDS